MKHKKAGKKFGRVTRQRKALLRTLSGSLILNEKISTTEAKAKALKPLMDRLINKAKAAQKMPEKKVAIIRDLQKSLAQVAIRKLTTPDFLSRFESRNSGYTRLAKNGFRKSDSAPMAVIEFV